MSRGASIYDHSWTFYDESVHVPLIVAGPNVKARQVLTFLSDTAIKEVKKNGLFVVPGLGRSVDRNGRTDKKMV